MDENDWVLPLLRSGWLSAVAIFVLAGLVAADFRLLNTAAAAPQPASEPTPGELLRR